MNDKEPSLRRQPLLPIYRTGHLTDGICIGLIFVGMLLSTGFFSSSPGSLIIPFCRMLSSWFGVWAIIFSFLMVLGGIAVLLLRWVLPRVRAGRIKQAFSVLLAVFAILIGLTLSALYGGAEGGGQAGMALAKWLTAGRSPSQVSFLLWVCLILDVCLLFGGTKWIPRLFGALYSELRDLLKRAVRTLKPEPVEESPSAFDWEAEYRASMEAGKKQNDEKESSGEREPDTDESAVREEKAELRFPIFGKRKKTTNMTENKSVPETIVRNESAVTRSNRLPPLNLLDSELGFYGQNTDHHDMMRKIEDAMQELGTPVIVTGCSVGPSVIQYQVMTGSVTRGNSAAVKNTKVSEVAGSERDLAVMLGVSNLSIQAPVPGENYIGIDIPNPQAMTVRLRPLLESPEFRHMRSPLAVALGRDIMGHPVVADLGAMPHLLVAGTTNSGKSICLRSMAICLAMNNTPEQLRFVIIDPKRVEFHRFNGLPHLLGKVENDFERSVAVLQWAVIEMQNRYKLFQKYGVKKLSIYNRKAVESGLKPLPYIVIIIDEMAEIMRGPDKTGLECIEKLSSLARATGMHLIVATQRPDVSIINGKIKTNIPARIALKVTGGVNSRVIMDKNGAEKLLGRGDLYFVDPSTNVPLRVQGPLLTDNEIDKVVNLWKKLAPKPTSEVNSTPWDEILEADKQNDLSRDEKKLKEAIRLVCSSKRATASFITSKMKISQPTASRLLNQMEELGVIGPMQIGNKSREVFWDEEQAEDFIMNFKPVKKEEEEDFDE